MPAQFPVSILDFVAISGTDTPRETIARTVEVAQLAERLGYKRYWVPEHHNHLGLAFTSTEVMIEHLAAATERIRVGAAGVMLPNHAPLKVAEVFRTLEAIHPGRIDLGLGRAPGTDGLTAYALRRGDTADHNFGQQAGELFAFLYDDFPADHPYRQVVAAPQSERPPEIFMLGSSEYGPRFAAVNGLTAVFAHHMSPDLAVPALRDYRRAFQPSKYLAQPRSIVSALAFASEDPAMVDAAIATWTMFGDRLRRGERGPRAGLDEALEFARTDEFKGRRAAQLQRVFAGEPGEVASRLRQLVADTEADELVVISPLGEQAPRLRSFEHLAAELGLSAGVSY